MSTQKQSQPRRKLKIPAEVRDQIEAMIRDGVLARKISRDLGVSRTFIRCLCLERNLPVQYKRRRYPGGKVDGKEFIPSPSQIEHGKWEIRNRGFTYLPRKKWYEPKDPNGEPEPVIIVGEEIPK